MKADFLFYDGTGNFKEEKFETNTMEELNNQVSSLKEKLSKEWDVKVRARKIHSGPERILKVKIKKEWKSEWEKFIISLGYYYEEARYCWVVEVPENEDISKLESSPYVLSVEDMPMVVLE